MWLVVCVLKRRQSLHNKRSARLLPPSTDAAPQCPSVQLAADPHRGQTLQDPQAGQQGLFEMPVCVCACVCVRESKWGQLFSSLSTTNAVNLRAPLHLIGSCLCFVCVCVLLAGTAALSPSQTVNSDHLSLTGPLVELPDK